MRARPIRDGAAGAVFALRWRASRHARVVPIRALVAQAPVWASVLVVSGSFDTLTDYAMFAILAFVAMATASVFVFRRRWPDCSAAVSHVGLPAGAGPVRPRDGVAAGEYAGDGCRPVPGRPGAHRAGPAVLFLLVARRSRIVIKLG